MKIRSILKISLLLSVVLVGVYGLYFTYNHAVNLPKKVNAYHSISIGMPMVEVKYILGRPDLVLKPINKFNFSGRNKFIISGNIFGEADQEVASDDDILNAKEGVNDFFDWHYSKSSSYISINFDPQKRIVKSIGCHFSDGNEYLLKMGICEINGIHALDGEDEVLAKLGEPSSSKIIDGTKIMYFNKYNMKIFLSKKIVRGIEVLDMADNKID